MQADRQSYPGMGAASSDIDADALPKRQVN